MSKAFLALGPVMFQDFELPPTINFGGRQRLAIHKLSAGRRVIDCMGRDDEDIVFAGILSGPNASLRARILDQIRISGSSLPLTWDVFFYTVVLQNFAANYQNDAWIPYALSCTVVRDESATLLQPGTSAAEEILQNLSTASNMSALAAVDLSSVGSAMAAPGALSRGTSAYYKAQESLQAGTAMLDSRIERQEPEILAVNFDDIPAPQALSALASGVNGAQQLSALVAARSFLGRAGTVLARGTAGQ